MSSSPPRRPSVLTTPASPPSLNSPSQPLRQRTSTTQLSPVPLPLSSHPPARSRSRSPSPSPTLRSSLDVPTSPSATAALVQAGLGLVGSLPPSPRLSSSPRMSDDDAVEQLVDPSRDGGLSPAAATGPRDGEAATGGGRTRSPSAVGFVEPVLPQRDAASVSSKERGKRERKRSFIGLGFGGGGGGDDSEGSTGGRGGFARRMSFFGGGGGGGADRPPADSPVTDSFDPPRPSPPALAPPVPAPSTRKSSGPKALLRRAKSFGTTSPNLSGSASGTFAPAPPSPVPAPSPVLPDLPRLSTSSLSFGAPTPTDSPSASYSGFSTPLTPSSSSASAFPFASSASLAHPYPHSHSHPYATDSPAASTSTMVLPEPVPAPHWLFQSQAQSPTSPPRAPPSSLDGTGRSRASSEGERRRHSVDERGADEPGKGAQEKGKGRDEPPRKQKARRATLGGLFGRKGDKAAAAAADRERDRDSSLEAQRSSGDSVSVGGGPVFDSPAASPALAGPGLGAGRSRSGSGTGAGTGASMPSLPSLPSLQLSNNPYRMSWAFGGTSPVKNGSPARSPPSGANGPPASPSPVRRSSSGSGRPSLSITTTPSSGSPAPASPASSRPHSPTKPSPLGASSPSLPQSPIPSRPPLTSAQSLPIPAVPPPLHHAVSSDSAATLLPSTSSSSPRARALSGSSSPSSTSLAPNLRRSNSYIPPSSSPGASPYTPLTRSPLSSPTAERTNPLALSSGPLANGGGSSSPSFARTLARTRQARSHSDASDRPSQQRPPVLYAGGRNMVIGGMGYPAAGGTFAQAGLRAGEKMPRSPGSGEAGDGRRPSTSTSAGEGRSSVFGSLGSFFHGPGHPSSSSSGAGSAGVSAGMSRSSSAATASTNAAGTPAHEPGLSEFGALFDAAGGAGRNRRSASVSRPGSGRKRGLSVGAGIGSLFGRASGSGNGSGNGQAEHVSPSSSVAGLTAPAEHPVTAASTGTGTRHGRNRSGSAGSALPSPSVSLAPPDGFGVAGGRVRALTDPNRRFSLIGSGAGAGGLSPSPSGTGLASRPGSSDGLVPQARTGRSRGSSLSMVLGGAGAGAGAGSASPARPPMKKERKAPPPRVEEGETPEAYVRRLMDGEEARVVRRKVRREGEEADAEQDEEEEEVEVEGTEALPRGEITRALASHSDSFHAAALSAYLDLFPFTSLALDIALRVFLSSASLPSETQQIDRVMEAFARRYCRCNPGVFPGRSVEKDGAGSAEEGAEEKRKEGEESDVPYVLAFSMVMLNTDHFNPNAKSKMTKADYVKNTRIDGVAPEVLEYLYDQITLAPFIFVDPSSSSGADDATSPLSLSAAPTPSVSSSSLLGGSVGPGHAMPSSSGFFGGNKEKAKVDPYHLISTGQTQRFRVDVESHIPSKSPFSFTGTTGFFNSTTLHTLFARAPILQITTRSRSSSKSSPSPQVTQVIPPPLPTGPDGAPSPSSALDGSPLVPTVSTGTFIVDPPKKKDKPTVSSLKITKIGLLSRKEDLAEGGKKAASRKWKGWSVVLTGSQLLFFKDPHFAASLQHALDTAIAASEPKPDDNHVLVFTIQTPFKPDAVLSLANSAAVYDSTYNKYRNVFRLVAPAGRQYLFQAHNTDDLNAWLHAINYAAAFKSANVRIRPLLPTAPPSAASSVRSSPAPASPRFPQPLTSTVTGLPPPAPAPVASGHGNGTTLGSVASTLDAVSPNGSLQPSDDDTITLQPSTNGNLDASLPQSLQDALQTQAANGNGTGQAHRPPALVPAVPPPDLAPSPRPSDAAFASLPSVTARADLLRTKINELDAQVSRARRELQADLRLAKHLAILTPFRSSTREKVLTAIPPIEKRVRHARMHLAKLVCYREVLSRDLLVEDRETERLVRKHSHRRTHSRRTSSIPRNRSPVPPAPGSPRNSTSNGGTAPSSSFTSPLSRSTSSLRPPRASYLGDSEHEHTPRSSFESTATAASLNGFFDAPHPHAHFGQSLSLTDDELDRLQLRAPPAPAMQRSRTESDWALDPSALGGGGNPRGSLGRSASSDSPRGLGIPLDRYALAGETHAHPAHALQHLHLQHSEDELEVPPPRMGEDGRHVGGAGTPIKKRSMDPGEMLVRGTAPGLALGRAREPSQEVLSALALGGAATS
ncbi:hypothetical protein JCM10207_003538 [Rhodosporidiobolus poonsookiae]